MSGPASDPEWNGAGDFDTSSQPFLTDVRMGDWCPKEHFGA